MTNAKRTIFLAVAAVVALSSLGEGVAAAAASSTTHAASPFVHRDLQSNNVLTVCPDGKQCTRGRRCYKTGREADSGLDEYACGDCLDIDDNNGRCEFAEEVFCIVDDDDADTSQWFCVNEGRCINDRVGSIE